MTTTAVHPITVTRAQLQEALPAHGNIVTFHFMPQGENAFVPSLWMDESSSIAIATSGLKHPLAFAPLPLPAFRSHLASLAADTVTLYAHGNTLSWGEGEAPAPASAPIDTPLDALDPVYAALHQSRTYAGFPIVARVHAGYVIRIRAGEVMLVSEDTLSIHRLRPAEQAGGGVVVIASPVSSVPCAAPRERVEALLDLFICLPVA